MPVYKRNQWLLLLICLLFGCLEAAPGRKGILTVNHMKLVMWDMVQVDEFSTAYVAKDSTRNLLKERNMMYQKVFALHRIDSSRFFKSYQYYKTHPDDYKILMDSLSAFGNRERDNRVFMNSYDKIPSPQ